MKVTLESTWKVVDLVALDPGKPLHGRVWQGRTAEGVEVACVVVRIASPADADQHEFLADLVECAPPGRTAVEAFPMRLIL